MKYQFKITAKEKRLSYKQMVSCLSFNISKSSHPPIVLPTTGGDCIMPYRNIPKPSHHPVVQLPSRVSNDVNF